MTTTQKVLLTILIAMVVALLCGSGPHWREHLVEIEAPHNATYTPDVDWYQRMFVIYNREYFHGRLNLPTIHSQEIAGFQNEATTECKDDGTNCVLEFSPIFNAAPRDAAQHLLHEMCHVKTWTEDQNKLILGADELTRHGKHWRGCMLELDNAGGWRNIIIDFYKGAE